MDSVGIISAHNKEYVQIVLSAVVTGPLTWPLAAELIARQQGNNTYRFLSTLRTKGFRYGFSGCAPYTSYKLFGIGAQRGVQTPVLEYLDNGDFVNNKLVQYILAGIASGVIGGAIVTPVEQFKISLANKDFSSYKQIKAFFCKDIKSFTSLFAGAKSTIVRNVVFDSVNSILYNGAIANKAIDKKNAVHMGAINCSAGVLTAVIDYPLDVIKTRVQSGTVYRNMSQVKTPSIWSTAEIMVRQEGWKSLYGGLQHKLSLYAAVWLVYGVSFGTLGSLL